MKKTNSILAIVAIAATSLFSSCAKDGATGATGPTGPAGAVGATGPAGTGAHAKDTTITMTSGSWTASTNYDYATISVPQITSTFLANGEVIVYFSANGGVQWDPVPYTTLNPVGYSLTYYVNPGTFGIYFGPAANPNTFFSAATIQFRLVFLTNGIIKQHPGTNWNDYSQVMSVVHQSNLN